MACLSLYQQDASVIRGGVYYSLAPNLRLGLVSVTQTLLTYAGEQRNNRRRVDFGIASEIMLEGEKDINLDIHTSIGVSKYSLETNSTQQIFVENETGFAIGSSAKFLRIGVGTRVNVDALGEKTENLEGCKSNAGSLELCSLLFVYPYVGGSWSI